jgi:hypothetical protein
VTTTSTETITRLELVKRAYRRCGVDYPSVTRVNQGVALLNDIMKELDTEGRWLHSINTTPSAFTTVAAQRSYGTLAAGEAAGADIAANILRLEWIEIVQGTARRPLRIIYEMEAISNIQRESPGGQPYFAFLATAPLQVNQKIHLFPTPNAAYVVNYNFRRRLYDFLLATDNPDMPPDWNQRLVKRLSAELAPELGLPLEERAQLRTDADQAMHDGKSANAENATPAPRRNQYF